MAAVPHLSLLRELKLTRAPGLQRPRHLSAASGLARVGGHLYVIADDEHHLGIFSADDHQRAGTLLGLRRGTLPQQKEARKRRKSDFEALVLLPPFAAYPYGALFALGSGSRPNRRLAVIVELNADGSTAGRPRTIGLSGWFAPLQREFGDINIEGAFIDGDHLALLQRANRGSRRNARIRIALAPLLDALAKKRAMPVPEVADIIDFTLGVIDDVPLSFTDGAALNANAFAFTAVAEATDDSYADGECVGAAIGIVAGDRVHALWQLVPPLKVEGIDARITGQGLELMVVTDADDSSVPAQLLTVTLRRR